MTQSRGQNEKIDPSFPEELRDRYDEVRFLGKGGMGSVYFARDIRLNRFVAIKLLPHTSDNTSSVVRFHQEAKAVSKLNNPHVVQVLDFGSTDDCDFFLVMEYIEGEDLEASITKNGPIPVLKAINIAMQVCTALEHAHAHGIVHRDLKPANIMIDENQHVRILDFGVAKIVGQADPEGRLTKPGQAVGSVLYMSPEQLRGEEADARSDVYSVGLFIYKIIAGKLPHEDEQIMKIIRLRLEEAPPALPLQKDDAKVIEKLNALLSTALANKPMDRFDSMTALKNALSDCLSSQEAEQHRIQRSKSAQRLIGLGAIICLVVTGVALVLQRTHPPTKATKKEISITREKPKEPQKKISPAEKTKDGIWMPPGFSELNDNGQIFWVAHDYVTNEDLKSLANSGVTSLSLQSNQNVTDVGISIINSLKLPLISLRVRDTRVGDASIDYINNMNLHNLDLRHCNVTENGFLRLKPSIDIVTLDLKYLPIARKGLEHVVRSFPNLVSLNIGETPVKKGDLDLLQKLPKLRYLYIEAIGLDDKTFEKLARRNKIIWYELADNPITDASIDYLLKKTALKWVSFKGCEHVSDKAIARLQNRFPDAVLVKRTAEKPPDDLNNIFFKEYE